MRHIIFNPETGMPVRAVDSPAQVTPVIADLQSQGRHVADLAAQPMDRTWSAAWGALMGNPPKGRHCRLVPVSKPNGQPAIPGV